MQWLRARVRVDAADPRLEPRMRVAERLVLPQHAVEELVVARVVDERVLQERERRHVRGRELVAEQVRAAGQERLEEVERAGELDGVLADAGLVGTGALELRRELVRGPLP